MWLLWLQPRPNYFDAEFHQQSFFAFFFVVFDRAPSSEKRHAFVYFAIFLWFADEIWTSSRVCDSRSHLSIFWKINTVSARNHALSCIIFYSFLPLGLLFDGFGGRCLSCGWRALYLRLRFWISGQTFCFPYCIWVRWKQLEGKILSSMFLCEEGARCRLFYSWWYPYSCSSTSKLSAQYWFSHFSCGLQLGAIHKTGMSDIGELCVSRTVLSI